jgi:D-sedoheptulose 7-phosphate isomerase
MPFFPDRPFSDCATYGLAYFDLVREAQAGVSGAALSEAAVLLEQAVRSGATIFSCGNGGSAAIANHLLCDYLKGISTGATIKPRVITLSSTTELITAIANDIGVEEIFAHPLRSLGQKADVLIAISSSGQSPNIVKAIETARAMHMRVIALTGFSGGRSSELADVSLHVNADNYGVVEDVHHSIMHIIAQYLKQAHYADPAALGSVPF